MTRRDKLLIALELAAYFAALSGVLLALAWLFPPP